MERIQRLDCLTSGIAPKSDNSSRVMVRAPGFAIQILVADVKSSPAEELGVLPRHAELNRAVLLKLGVPDEVIVPFGDNASSTYEEARALAAWARATGAKTVIIPTDLFPTRRVRWLMARELGAVGVRVMVEAVAPPEYTMADWWQHEEGLIAFQNEVIKYLILSRKILSLFVPRNR